MSISREIGGGIMGEFVVAKDGVRIHTAATGEGVPLLFCHGGPGCSDYTQPFVRARCQSHTL